MNRQRKIQKKVAIIFCITVLCQTVSLHYSFTHQVVVRTEAGEQAKLANSALIEVRHLVLELDRSHVENQEQEAENDRLRCRLQEYGRASPTSLSSQHHQQQHHQQQHHSGTGAGTTAQSGRCCSGSQGRESQVLKRMLLLLLRARSDGSSSSSSSNSSSSNSSSSSSSSSIHWAWASWKASTGDADDVGYGGEASVSISPQSPTLTAIAKARARARARVQLNSSSRSISCTCPPPSYAPTGRDSHNNPMAGVRAEGTSGAPAWPPPPESSSSPLQTGSTSELSRAELARLMEDTQEELRASQSELRRVREESGRIQDAQMAQVGSKSTGRCRCRCSASIPTSFSRSIGATHTLTHTRTHIHIRTHAHTHKQS